MLLVLCGVLFHFTYGYHHYRPPTYHWPYNPPGIGSYPVTDPKTYETSHPWIHFGHTYEARQPGTDYGTHIFGTGQPGTGYGTNTFGTGQLVTGHGTHTFETGQPLTNDGSNTRERSQPDGQSHDTHSWQMQWRKHGWVWPSGDYGASQGGQNDAFRAGHVGSGQNNTTNTSQEVLQEKFTPFEQSTKPNEGIGDNSKAAETISNPLTDEINHDQKSNPPPLPTTASDNDESGPPPFPGDVSDDSKPPLFPGDASDDHFEADHVGSGQDNATNPNQEVLQETFTPFEQATKRNENIDNNSRAAETISNQSTTEINNDQESKPPPLPSNASDYDESEPPPFPGDASDDGDDSEPPPFPGDASDNGESEPPPFPGDASDDGNDSEPPPFPGHASDNDESEPLPFPGDASDDGDDSEPPPFPGHARDNEKSEPPPFPGDANDDGDDSEPTPFPGYASDNDKSEPPPFPGDVNADGDDSVPPPFTGVANDNDESEPPLFPGVANRNDNSKSPPFPGETSDDDENAEPPPFPSSINDDESFPNEGSGVTESSTTDETINDTTISSDIIIDDVTTASNNEVISNEAKPDEISDVILAQPPDEISDLPSEGTAESAPQGKNDLKSDTSDGTDDSSLKKIDPITSNSPRWSYVPAYQAEPGTMSRPVPKIGLLFAPALQWHVGIYSKTFTPYMQICGGSLVKADVVLSAAHCFWNDDVGALRPALFAVAAGKLLRPWETDGETYTQYSDINDIKIPPRFRGGKTNFQDDIAILLLSKSLEYAPGVKPVCVSFDLEVEQRHLTSGNIGTVAGWGLTEPNGLPSQRLNYLGLPYVEIEECLRTADDSFLKYITSDKICAGDQKSGRAVCRGDSGGGLIFYSSTIPYIHGIASTAPRDENECNAYAVGSFTQVRSHRMFLIQHVPGIAEGCEELYVNATGSMQNKTTESNGLTQYKEEDRSSANIAVEQMSNVSSGPQLSWTALSNTNGETIEKTPSEDFQELNDSKQVNESKDVNETKEVNKSGVNETKEVYGPNKVNESEVNESKEVNESQDINESRKVNESEVNGSQILNKSEVIDSKKENETKEVKGETNERNKELSKSNDKAIGTDKGNEKEVMMNVGSGETGVARVLIDNNTRSFVCNCYCNK